MADPIGITASVIIAGGLVYSSCKALNDMISSFPNTPRSLSDLHRDFDAIQDLLQPLILVLNSVEDPTLSADQKNSFINLQHAIKACQATCDKIAAKLSDITYRSDTDHAELLDGGRPQFDEEEILMLKAELERDKQTLNIAVGIATYQSIRQHRNALQSLETKIVTSMGIFTNQIQGLQLPMESISISDFNVKEEDVDAIAGVLNKHGRMLRQSLESHNNSPREATAASSTKVRYAKVFNEARQFIGNLGNIQFGPETPAVAVDSVEARDKARQVVGNMSEEAAKNFWL